MLYFNFLNYFHLINLLSNLLCSFIILKFYHSFDLPLDYDHLYIIYISPKVSYFKFALINLL